MITSEHTLTHQPTSINSSRSKISNFTASSNSSLQSKLGSIKLEELYKKITNMVLLMKENKIDETSSLLQSVITMESELKSEKCRDRLSFLYIFVLGLCNKMKLQKPPESTKGGFKIEGIDKIVKNFKEDDKENSGRNMQNFDDSKRSGEDTDRSFISSLEDIDNQCKLLYLIY